MRHDFARKRIHADSPFTQHHDSMVPVKHGAVWPHLQRAGSTQRQRLDKLGRRQSTKLVELHSAEDLFRMQQPKRWLPHVHLSP